MTEHNCFCQKLLLHNIVHYLMLFTNINFDRLSKLYIGMGPSSFCIRFSICNDVNLKALVRLHPGRLFLVSAKNVQEDIPAALHDGTRKCEL